MTVVTYEIGQKWTIAHAELDACINIFLELVYDEAAPSRIAFPFGFVGLALA